MKQKIPNVISFIFLLILQHGYCQTTITKWQHDKKGAISITYDDGIKTQFTQVLPIMNRLHFPGTFFIVTGDMKGSNYHAKFAGRPISEIMNESKTIKTNANNFFERASAVRFLGYKGTATWFYKAGSCFEEGKLTEAYRLIDSVYSLALSERLQPGRDTTYEAGLSAQNSWEDFKKYASQGYEFACHSLSHPFMAILDSANMYYELEKCKEDIENHLGKSHSFSAEVPFGTEDERVMKFVLQSKLFHALRNKMPEPYMYEINRGYKEPPGHSSKEYVQWQRGPLTNTLLSEMKSWVDTLIDHDNIWLVLVFHGVDNLGWEPIQHDTIASYFQYMKQKENNLWIATFQDVTKYLRERMATKITEIKRNNSIVISLQCPLDSAIYNLALTLKTYIPATWKQVSVLQDKKKNKLTILKDETGNYVLTETIPNKGKIELSAR